MLTCPKNSVFEESQFQSTKSPSDLAAVIEFSLRRIR
jgi:hypothetical protein